MSYSRDEHIAKLLVNGTSHDEYQEVCIESGGYPIILSIWKATSAKRSIVFLPGTGDHPLLYEEFLAGLAAKGNNVIGVHLAGSGKSPRRDLKYTWSTYKQNAMDAVAYAHKEFAGIPVGISGSSQGGILGLQAITEIPSVTFALLHNLGIPANKDSVELTTLPGFLRHMRWLTRAPMIFMSWFRSTMPLWMYLDESGIFSDEELRQINKEDPIKNRYLPIRFFLEFMQSRPSIPVAEISMPICVIASDQDRIFPVDYIRRHYDEIGSANKELMLFEGRGHMLLVEAPHEVLPRALSWLDSLPM